MAYLMHLREWWNALLPASDHLHEVGENTAGCPNCRLEELGRRLSPYEGACLTWYSDHVTPFTMQGGIVGQLILALGLEGKALALFLRAMDMIRSTFQDIELEHLKRQREAQANG